MNGNGEVGLTDLLEVFSLLGRSPSKPGVNQFVDQNNDGIIDLFDLVIVARNMGSQHFPEQPSLYPIEPEGLSLITTNQRDKMPRNWGFGQWGHYRSPNNPYGDTSIVQDPIFPRRTESCVVDSLKELLQ